MIRGLRRARAAGALAGVVLFIPLARSGFPNQVIFEYAVIRLQPAAGVHDASMLRQLSSGDGWLETGGEKVVAKRNHGFKTHGEIERR